MTASGGSPTILAAVPCSSVWNCVPTHSSQRPFSIFTVQLSGSMVACAR
jgi:hypothetical protein